MAKGKVSRSGRGIKGRDREILTEQVGENMLLRVTVSKTLQLLLPLGSFVICQQAFIFLEVLNLSFSDY